ncbi:SsrA-binding protein SmpB [Thiohalophilus thiocyanatoxydans]|uniref:SsrA-binding protein n=1 Tax=Thiohalophilus thiocyanatoxydans TaxID=381308 RepID=A0A4R8IX64_9GAMM|nr:SsrA-binding protein SmpB [Thiohalophilus thiocyanatoxydans]TDY02457.1 SsrA-binding protein [Thiohalophilus thiocyanatoxydans]
MAKQQKKSARPSSTIALNKKSRHDYTLEDRFEAGLELQGWEVKSLREGRIQLRDSYVILKGGEAWLLGAVISPLQTVSTHIQPEPQRTRKLLLHREELNKLIGAVERKGYSLIPTAMYWKKGRAKLEIALAKGKQSHDKRAAIKERDWQRDKQRIIKGVKS